MARPEAGSPEATGGDGQPTLVEEADVLLGLIGVVAPSLKPTCDARSTTETNAATSQTVARDLRGGTDIVARSVLTLGACRSWRTCAAATARTEADTRS